MQMGWIKMTKIKGRPMKNEFKFRQNSNVLKCAPQGVRVFVFYL